MTLRMSELGRNSATLLTLLVLAGATVCLADPPAEPAGAPAASQPAATRPASSPASQEGMKRLQEIREQMQREREAKAAAQAQGGPNGPLPEDALHPAPQSSPPRPAPTPANDPAARAALRQRAAQQRAGADVAPDFVGPPAHLAGPAPAPGTPIDVTPAPSAPAAVAPLEGAAPVTPPASGEVPHAATVETAPPARVEPPPPDDGRTEWFNFKDTPWEEVIQQFVDRIGKPLMNADTLIIGGTLTYQTTRRFTLEEAIDELNFILCEQGYYFVEQEHHIRVVPTSEMRQWVPVDRTFPSLQAFLEAEPRDMEFVTVYYQVSDLPAQQYVDLFLDALSEGTLMQALKDSNQIKITALARDVRKFVTLKDMINIEPSDPRKLKIFPIKTSATDIEARVRAFLDLSNPAAPQMRMVRDPRTGQMIPQPVPAPAGGAQAEVQMVADERTNSIIVKATEDKLKEIEKLVATLDEKPPLGEFKTTVVPVKHGDAAEFANLLNQILQQEQGQARAMMPNWQMQRQAQLAQMAAMRNMRNRPGQPPQPMPQPMPNPGVMQAGTVQPEDLMGEGLFERARKTVRMVAEPRTNSLIVYANEDGLKRVKEILDIIDQPIPDQLKTVVLVNAKVGDIATLVNDLVLATSQATATGGRVPTIVPDENNNSFHVIAERADLERIEAIIDKFDVPGPERTKHVVELRNLRPSQVAQMVQPLLQAKGGGSAAARSPAVPTPQRFGGRRGNMGGGFTPPTPSATVTASNDFQLIPLDEAQVLIVICSDDDWDKIAETIQLWDDRALTNTPQMRTFTVTQGNPAAVATLLGNMYRTYDHPTLGRSQVFVQAEGKTLYAYGVKPALEEIEQLLPQIDVESSEQIAILPLANADASQVAQQAQQLFAGRGGGGMPGGRGGMPMGGGGPLIQAEPMTNSLIVQGEPADIDKVKDYAMQMDQRIATLATEQRFYTPENVPAAEIATAIQNFFANAARSIRTGMPSGSQVKASASGAVVIVEAPKEKFAEIETFIKRIDAKKVELVTKLVKLPGADVNQVAQMLNQTVSRWAPRADRQQATFIPDVATETVIVSAPVDWVPEIDRILQQFATGGEELTLERRVYPVKQVDAAWAAEILRQSLLSEAGKKGPQIANRINLAIDDRQNQIILNAPRFLHGTAETLLKELDREGPDQTPVTITPKYADPNQLAQMIQTMFRPSGGGGRPVQDVQVAVTNGQLIVKAPPKKLAEIRDVVEAADTPDTGGVQVKMYDLKVLNAAQVQLAVQGFLAQLKKNQKAGQLQPGAYAEPTTNTLVVLAPPDVLPMIDAMILELEGKTPPTARAQSYTLRFARADQLWQQVDAMLKAKVAEREGVKKGAIQTLVTSDPAGNRLFVYAPEDYQELAASLIAMVDTEVETAEIVHILPLNDGDAQQVAQALNATLAGGGRTGTTAPRVRITADPGSNSLLIAGLPKDVADAEKLVRDLEINSVRVPELQRFRLKYAMAKQIEDVLKSAYPAARGGSPQDAVTITVDEYANTVLVSANKRKMREVERFIAELDAAPTAEEERGTDGRGRIVYFVDIARGRASDVAWDVRALFPRESEGGPSIESDWFDEYLIVKCRETEFPKILQYIREFEKRAKIERKVVTYRPKANTDALLQYLTARDENIVVEQAGATPRRESIVRELWGPDEEPESVKQKREKQDKPDAPKPSKPAATERGRTERPQRTPLAWRDGLANTGLQVALCGLTLEDPAPAATKPAPRGPVVVSAEREDEAAPAVGGAAQRVPSPLEKEPPRVVRQPDGTLIILGDKKKVDDIVDTLDVLQQDLASGEVIRIYKFRYGDVSAAAEILQLMFNETRQLLLQQAMQPQQPQQRRGGQGGREDEDPRAQGMFDQLRGMVGGPAGPQQRGGSARAGQTGGQRMRIATDPGHNYLIIKCDEVDLPEIERLLRELDIPPGEVQVKIFQLKNLLADETAQNISDVLGISKAQSRRGGTAGRNLPMGGRPGMPGGQQQQLIEMLQQQLVSVPGVEGGAKVERVEIVPNSTTNSLLVSAPPEVMGLIERVIGELEELEGRDVIGIHHYPLQKARVDDVLPLLQEIFEAAGAGGGGGGRSPMMFRMGGFGGFGGFGGGGKSPAALGPVTVSADPRTNTIIYTAEAKDVPTIEHHIRMLDLEGPVAEAELYVCEYGNAESIASVVTAIYGGAGAGRSGRRTGFMPGGETAGGSDVRIEAEPATNSIVVFAPRDKRDLILNKIRELDRLADQIIREIPVQFADPTKLAQTLSDMFADTGGSGARSTGGARRTRNPLGGALGGGGSPVVSSGRITILGDKPSKKLLVRAPNEIFRQINELVTVLDRPDEMLKLKAFPLQHADAETVVESVKQAMTEYLQLARTTGTETDFDAFTAMPDPRTNSVVVVGSDKTFLFVANVVNAIDVPGIPKEFRIFKLEKAEAATVADAINSFAGSGAGAGGGGRRRGGMPGAGGGTSTRELSVTAVPDEATNTVMVFGKAEDIDRIETAVINRLEEAVTLQIATLPVVNVPPSQLVGFITPFVDQGAGAGSSARGGGGARPAGSGVSGPQMVPNDGAKSLVVRGTKRQIDEVRRLVEQFDDKNAIQDRIKVIQVPYGQDAVQLAADIERIVNKSEDEAAKAAGRPARLVSIGADVFTNTLIVAGDPAQFGLVAAVVQQLADIGGPTNVVTRVIEFKNLSARDAEDAVNLLQQKKSGSGAGRSAAPSRRSTGGGSAAPARPSGNVTPPPARPSTPSAPPAAPRGGSAAPSPTPRSGGAAPAPRRSAPGGGGGGGAKPGGGMAPLVNPSILTGLPTLATTLSLAGPVIAQEQIIPILGRRGGLLEDDPPARKPASATQPATAPSNAERLRRLREAIEAGEAADPAEPRPRPARGPAVDAAVTEPADEAATTGPTDLTATLSGVSGALRGEVVARAVDGQRLIITGDARDLDFVEEILRMMEVSTPQPQIEVFVLQSAKATALAPIIEKAVKGELDIRASQDRFSINAEARSNALIVAAPPHIMERIAELVDRLDGATTTEGADVRSVVLEHIRASEAVSLLRPTIERLNRMREVPTESQAAIEPVDRNNSVLITGTKKDVEEIEQLIRTIDVEISAKQEGKSFVAADVVLVQLENASAEDVAKVLSDMIDKEQEAATQAGGGGTGAARAGKPFVKKLRLRLADGRELPELDLERPIKVIAEKGTNSLIIFSSKDNNEALAAIVGVFDTLPNAPDTDVKVFVLQHAAAETVAKLLQDTFSDKSYLKRPVEGSDGKNLPQGKLPPVPPGLAAKGLPYPLAVQFDARTNTVLLIGRRDAVVLAGGLIKELDRPTVDLGVKTHVIELRNATATTLMDKLRKLLDDRSKALGADKNAARDNAVIQADERANALIVLATDPIYDMIEDLAQQLDTAEKYSIVDTRYRPLLKADAAKLKGLLDESFKAKKDAEAKSNKDSSDTLSVLADTRGNGLLLTGTRDYLAEAEKLIVQFDRDFDGAVVLKAIKLKLNTAPNVAALLQDMVDKALKQTDSKLSGTPINVTADPVSDTLLLAAARDDMAMLERWVEILDRPSEVGRMIKILPLRQGVAEDVSKAVTDIFKKQAGGTSGGGAIDVTVTADKVTNSVVAFGPPALVADIEKFVQEYDGVEGRKGAMVRMFKLKQADAEQAGDLLQRILDLRGGSVGGSTGGGGTTGTGRTDDAASRVLLIFQKDHPDLGLETLKALRTEITVISDLRTNTLTVMAPAESMPLMESLVAAVDVPPEDAKIRVFRLRNADAEQMVTMLEALFGRGTSGSTTRGRTTATTGETERVLTLAEGIAPGGRQEIAFTTDVRTNSVIAAGTPGYLDLVEKMIVELDTVPIEDRKTFVYAPRNIKAQTLAESITSRSDAEQQRLQEIGDEISTSQKQARRVTAIANEDANRVVLDYSPRFEDEVMNLVRQLDQPPPQVMIQVLILEVTMSNALDLGVEFAFQDLQYAKAGPADTTTFDYVGGTDVGASGSGLGGFTFTVTGADFNFLFRTLQSENNLKVLSRPQVVAINNKEATIDISNDVPYVTGTSTTTGGQITTSVARERIGIKLVVTPQINDDGYVLMDISQEVSDFSGSTVSVGNGVTAPVFFRRNVQTTITVKDQETVVLGGLITSRAENKEDKVPILGDIPGLGWLMRHQADSTSRTELLVVLTPQIVRTVEDYRNLSARERDNMHLIPGELLSDPLMQGLRREEPLGFDEFRGEPQPLDVPADGADEPYGPVRPALQPERGPAEDPDTYNVPLTLRTGS